MDRSLRRLGERWRYPARRLMFWLTSVAAITMVFFALRAIHTSRLQFRWFLLLLIVTLLAFNFSIVVIFAFYVVDAYPWSQPQMLFGVIAIAFLIALATRAVCPVHFRHLADHRNLLKTYALILVAGGFVGGVILWSPSLTRNYVIQSDRWSNLATAIAMIEITSLYSLMLTLILSIGSTSGAYRQSDQIAG